jgi:polyhydroxybutyrate depolymerase
MAPEIRDTFDPAMRRRAPTAPQGVSPPRYAVEGTFMRTALTVFIVSLVFVISGGDGFAQDGRFRRFDRNSDGRISPEELGAPRVFRAADTDADGFISPAEFGAAQRNRDEIPPPAVDSKASFLQTTHTLAVDGRERTYIVQAPRQHGSPLPVVFFFHGGGGRGANMARRGFGEMSATERFLAVYPDGWKGNWNDGRQAARIASQVDAVDDVKFVREMVNDLAKRHRIDRGRIFAAGVSNGGIFSHYLAAHAADLFAGIAPVIGGLAEPVATNFKPSHPISLLVIQGDADPLVPLKGGAIANRDRGGRIIATDEMLKKYLAHNGITEDSKTEQVPDRDPKDGTTTEIQRWPSGRDGVLVEYWLVKGGGHNMPGGRAVQAAAKEEKVGKVSRDFDALEVIWAFFKSCPSRKQQ